MFPGSFHPWGVAPETMRLSLLYTHGLCNTLISCPHVHTCNWNHFFLFVPWKTYTLTQLFFAILCHACCLPLMAAAVPDFSFMCSSSYVAKLFFAPNMWSKVLLPSVLSQHAWRTWLQLVQSCRHHTFFARFVDLSYWVDNNCLKINYVDCHFNVFMLTQNLWFDIGLWQAKLTLSHLNNQMK